jgi:hypothetical protein
MKFEIPVVKQGKDTLPHAQGMVSTTHIPAFADFTL